MVKANEAFYEKFLVPPQETEGAFIYEIGSGQWDIPALRSLLEEVLPQKITIKDFAMEHDFPTIGHRKMLLNARRLEANEMGKDLILLAIRDLTKPAKAPALEHG